MILFKGGQPGLEPCYDGHTLADAKAVAGDGLAAISIKQCHRHCHFTLNPDNKEPLLSCIQGLQARNTYLNLHKPDLRKVRGLECSTTASVTQLLRSHNPENNNKPTIKRRLFKILQSLGSSTTESTKLADMTKLSDTNTSLQPNNICVLSTLEKNPGMNNVKNDQRDDYSRAEKFQNSAVQLSRQIDNVAMNTAPTFSKQLLYDPLNRFSNNDIFLGPSTSYRIESCPVFTRETNENSSNLNLKQKKSSTEILFSIPADESMDEDDEQGLESDLKLKVGMTENIQEIQVHENIYSQTDISQAKPKTDLVHPKGCECLKSSIKGVSENLDEIISYITSANEFVDILELDSLSTPSSNRFDQSNIYIDDGDNRSMFQTDQPEIKRHMNTNGFMLLNLEEEQISFSKKDKTSQRKSAINQNNSSIITVNNEEAKRRKLDEYSLLTNYYGKETISKYSYWEDDDLSFESSTNKPFNLDTQSNTNTDSKTEIVPVQYFQEFWEECAFPYAGYFKNKAQSDSSIINQFQGYFHWENDNDKNILDEAEHIMRTINAFLDTNICLTNQRNTSTTIAEIESFEKISSENINNYLALPNSDKLGSWDNMHENERFADMPGTNPQKIAEHHTSNESLYDSSCEEMRTTQYQRSDAQLASTGMNPEDTLNCDFPYFDNCRKEAFLRRNILLQRTDELLQQIEESKNDIQDKLNCMDDKLTLSNLGQPLMERAVSTDKSIEAIYMSKSKEYVCRQNESKYDSPVHCQRGKENIYKQISKDFQLESSNILMNVRQVTGNNLNPVQEIDHSSVDCQSSARFISGPAEKKDEINSQLLFSSPQMPINLTNPLNNSTYK